MEALFEINWPAPDQFHIAFPDYTAAIYAIFLSCVYEHYELTQLP